MRHFARGVECFQHDMKPQTLRWMREIAGFREICSHHGVMRCELHKIGCDSVDYCMRPIYTCEVSYNVM